MPIMHTLRSSDVDPTGYVDRPTVKAVVTDGAGRVLLFSGSLLGGGIEAAEDPETALGRELMEEAGITVDDVHGLGTIVQFRDALKRKYLIHGFCARYVQTVSAPTTQSESEQKRSVAWYALKDAKALLNEDIAKIKQTGNQDPAKDSYQSTLFSSQTALLFIEEAERLGLLSR